MSLKWYFNASPKALGKQGTSYSIGFTSAGTHFSILRNGTVFKEKFYLYYDDTEAYRSGWKNSAYRTITFDTEPTGALLTYLEANATVVQEDPYKFKRYYKNSNLIGTGTIKFRPYTVTEPSPEPQVYTINYEISGDAEKGLFVNGAAQGTLKSGVWTPSGNISAHIMNPDYSASGTFTNVKTLHTGFCGDAIMLSEGLKIYTADRSSSVTIDSENWINHYADTKNFDLTPYLSEGCHLVWDGDT